MSLYPVLSESGQTLFKKRYLMTEYFKVRDILKVNMSLVKLHEQQVCRLIIVFSEGNVHKEADLIWVLPITNTDKSFPTHIPVNGRTKNKK